MEKFSDEAVSKINNWRYAVKKFDSSKKITAEHWSTLEESLHLAPSSYGLQPWRFVIVQSAEVRKKLTAVSELQKQVESCSHLVVITHLKKLTEDYVSAYFKLVAEDRSVSPESLKKYQENIEREYIHGPQAAHVGEWAARQTYIALGTFMMSAACLEIDTCPMEGLDPKKYDEILGLTSSPYTTSVVVAAGYRSTDDKSQHDHKIRFGKEQIFKYID